MSNSVEREESGGVMENIGRGAKNRVLAGFLTCAISLGVGAGTGKVKAEGGSAGLTVSGEKLPGSEEKIPSYWNKAERAIYPLLAGYDLPQLEGQDPIGLLERFGYVGPNGSFVFFPENIREQARKRNVNWPSLSDQQQYQLCAAESGLDKIPAKYLRAGEIVVSGDKGGVIIFAGDNKDGVYKLIPDGERQAIDCGNIKRLFTHISIDAELGVVMDDGYAISHRLDLKSGQWLELETPKMLGDEWQRGFKSMRDAINGSQTTTDGQQMKNGLQVDSSDYNTALKIYMTERQAARTAIMAANKDLNDIEVDREVQSRLGGSGVVEKINKQLKSVQIMPDASGQFGFWVKTSNDKADRYGLHPTFVQGLRLAVARINEVDPGKIREMVDNGFKVLTYDTPFLQAFVRYPSYNASYWFMDKNVGMIGYNEYKATSGQDIDGLVKYYGLDYILKSLNIDFIYHTVVEAAGLKYQQENKLSWNERGIAKADITINWANQFKDKLTKEEYDRLIKNANDSKTGYGVTN